MDKEQVVFEQLTLSDFNMWSSLVSMTFSDYTRITNNSNNIIIS